QENSSERTPASGAGKAESPSESQWTCGCGSVNTGKFCPECGNPKPSGTWTCECKTVNNGRFCSECGKPRP
ncbi:virion core protein, partial [Clostridioides difficile]|nr:virion core protein [Clostridioides difficile]